MSEEQYVTPTEPTLSEAVADLSTQPEAQVPDHTDEVVVDGNPQSDPTPVFVEPVQPEAQAAPDTVSPPVPDAANPAPPPEGTDAHDMDDVVDDAPDDFIDTVNQDDDTDDDVATEVPAQNEIDQVGGLVADTDVDPA